MGFEATTTSPVLGSMFCFVVLGLLMLAVERWMNGVPTPLGKPIESMLLVL